jgi:hypothetical protein
MIIIKFQDGTDWFKANWIFRQLAADTITAFPNDSALKQTLEKAQALGGLFLESVEADAAAAVVRALAKVAEDTVAGRIPGWKKTKPEDEEGQELYLKSVAELLDLINKQPRQA